MRRYIRGLGLLAILAAPLSAVVEGVKITTDRTVDASSLETIVGDVIRLSGAKSNDEKGIALYNYLHQVLFHNAYACEKQPRSVGPLKVINVYGWGLCGGEHTVMKAVFETAGWQVRYRGWDGHTTVEANYDGRWHYFDVFLKAWFWTKDRSTIAGQDDINADPSIVLDGLKDKRVPAESYLCCGDDAPGIVSGCKTSKPLPISKPQDGWASVTGRDQGYSPLLGLRSGGTVRLEWTAAPGMMVADGTKGRHTCPNLKDVRNNPLIGPVLEHYGDRSYSNGSFTYAPDFAQPTDVADIELNGVEAKGGKLVAKGAGAATATFTLALPYPFASATIAAPCDGGDAQISLSTDAGKTWQPVAAGDVSTLVRQFYEVRVKVDFRGALTGFKVDAIVEHNRAAQPYLYNGHNQVTVATAGNQIPAGTELVVTYVFQEATAAAKRDQFNGKGLTYGETRTVTKVITALPSSFALDVGGTTPPKMIAIERSLRAAKH